MTLPHNKMLRFRRHAQEANQSYRREGQDPPLRNLMGSKSGAEKLTGGKKFYLGQVPK